MGLSTLLAIVGLRSLAHMGLFTFVPLYEISEERRGLRNRLLALFLFAGAAGTLLGGRLADRIGRRAVLLDPSSSRRRSSSSTLSWAGSSAPWRSRSPARR